MRFFKKNFFIIILFLVMISLSILMISKPMIPENFFDDIVFCDVQKDINIKPYYDRTEDKFYLFLPSHIDKDSISIKCSDDLSLFFSDKCLKNGESLQGLPLSTDIPIKSYNNYIHREAIIHILQCRNIPTMYIETKTGTMQYINNDKRHREDAVVSIIDQDGTERLVNKTKIWGRGNTTWEYEKKPYNIKFDKPVNIFGITEAQTWSLFANYTDRSLIRNFLCYTVAKEMGIKYTSGMEFVSLFLNGQYNGVYTILTKNDYKNYTDDFRALFEKTDVYRVSDYQNQYNTYINFEYGNEEFVGNTINTFDKCLFEKNSFKEIEKLIDVNSFAKKYVIEELLANIDNRLSQYFTINNDGKIEAVCAWDYDLTLGTAWTRYKDTFYNETVVGNSWYKALFEYPEFRSLVNSIFEEFRYIFDDRLPNLIEETATYIANDWECDNIRYRFFEHYDGGRHIKKINTFDGQIKFIETFLNIRVDFFDTYFKNSDAFYKVSFRDGRFGTTTLLHIKGDDLSGDIYKNAILNVDDFDKNFQGWYTKDGIGIDKTYTIDKDITFTAKWANAPQTSSVIQTAVKRIFEIIPLLLFGICLAVLAISELVRWIKTKGGKR